MSEGQSDILFTDGQALEAENDRAMQLFESKDDVAKRKGYEEFDYVDSSDIKSEAGAS